MGLTIWSVHIGIKAMTPNEAALMLGRLNVDEMVVCSDANTHAHTTLDALITAVSGNVTALGTQLASAFRSWQSVVLSFRKEGSTFFRDDVHIKFRKITLMRRCNSARARRRAHGGILSSVRGNVVVDARCGA